MKTFYRILGLLLIDFGLIWLWVFLIDPDPSISIGLIVLVPLVFMANLIVGAILFFLKKKEFAKLFFLNSVLASIIFCYLFLEGIDRHQNNRLESWEFQKADSTFTLTRWKTSNEFSLTYSLSPHWSWGCLNGTYKNENDEWVLEADSIEMRIRNDNQLIGFRRPTDTIELKKIKR